MILDTLKFVRPAARARLKSPDNPPPPTTKSSFGRAVTFEGLRRQSKSVRLDRPVWQKESVDFSEKQRVRCGRAQKLFFEGPFLELGFKCRPMAPSTP